MSSLSLPTYAIVTPVRDEGEHLARTADSIVAQEHPPRLWVIVDDGSTDATPEIAAAYAAKHPWIRVVRRDRATPRARGGAVVAAFEAGLACVGNEPTFVVKLDGDLYLPPHYFRWIAATFVDDERAGIVGGHLYVPSGGRWVPDDVDPYSVHGAVKAYRLSCLQDIGGLHQAMGWDGIDEFAARARGWNVRSLSELHVLHYTPRGSKQRWVEARQEEGRGAHFMGYRFPYLLLRAGYRMLREHPRGAGGAMLFWGYVRARLQRLPQVQDPLAIAQLRKEHRARILRLVRLADPHSIARADPGPAYFASLSSDSIKVEP